MKINEIYSNYWESFKAGNGGFLRRKLMAFYGMITASVISYHYSSSDNVNEMAIIWLTFVSLCIGMVTFEQIVQLKNGSKNEAPVQNN